MNAATCSGYSLGSRSSRGGHLWSFARRRRSSVRLSLCSYFPSSSSLSLSASYDEEVRQLTLLHARSPRHPPRHELLQHLDDCSRSRGVRRPQRHRARAPRRPHPRARPGHVHARPRPGLPPPPVLQADPDGRLRPPRPQVVVAHRAREQDQRAVVPHAPLAHPARRHLHLGPAVADPPHPGPRQFRAGDAGRAQARPRRVPPMVHRRRRRRARVAAERAPHVDRPDERAAHHSPLRRLRRRPDRRAARRHPRAVQHRHAPDVDGGDEQPGAVPPREPEPHQRRARRVARALGAAPRRDADARRPARLHGRADVGPVRHPRRQRRRLHSVGPRAQEGARAGQGGPAKIDDRVRASSPSFRSQLPSRSSR